MHGAPSVSYPVGRSRFELALVLVILLLNLGVGAYWLQQRGGADLSPVLVLLLGLAAGGAGLWRWHAGAGAGELRWDGQHWFWHRTGGEQSGGLCVRLDWQFGVLVEFRPAGGRAHWFWLDRGEPHWRWEALRRALYASTRALPDGAAHDEGGGISV